MGKTHYHTAASIDGFIAGPGNSLDWLFEIGSGGPANDRFGSFMAGVGAMAMGAGAPLLPRRLLSSQLTLTGIDRDEHFAYLSYRVTPGTG